jgi:catechol 2,3-dioxygenase-like lactoylglutathione lyase family enzyme
VAVGIEVTGIDHLYLAVSDFDESERFYDAVMKTLGFKKGDRSIGGERHAHYFNRYLQLSIRPARTQVKHDSYAPGLHHLCLRLADRNAVDAAARELAAIGVRVSEPRLYPEYADDYYAVFFEDPDGIRHELVALRKGRQEIVEKWDRLDEFLNPLQRLREREGK